MRSGMRLLAAFLVLLLMLTGSALWLVQQRLGAAGIDQLDWHGLGWSEGALRVEALSARHTDPTGARLAIKATELLIEPVWAGGPALAVLQAQRLELDWEPRVGLPGARSAAMPDLEQLAERLGWLPSRRLSIPEIVVRLPCGIRICTLDGSLEVERGASDRFLLRLELLAEQGSILLDGQLQHDDQGLQADLGLRLDDAEAARLTAQWSYGSAAPESQGGLSIAGWPQADWLLDYAQPWLGVQPPVATLPTGLRADMRWRLAPLERPQTLADLFDGDVELTVHAVLARPWALPQLGSLDGEIDLDLLGDGGLWQMHQARAQLRLTEPRLPAWLALPVQLRPQSVQVEVAARAGSPLDWSETLALMLDARVAGPVAGRLAGPLTLVSGPQWSARWETLQLRVTGAELNLPTARLREIELGGSFAGHVDQHQLQLTMGADTFVEAAGIQVPDLVSLAGVRVGLAGFNLQFPFDNPAAVTVKGPLSASIGRLEHAALKPQGWTVKGELERDRERLRWEGSVASTSELGLGVTFAWPADAPWRADLILEPAFLRAGDPLSTTLQGWPELLTLGRGRVQGQLSMRGDVQLEQASGQIELEGAAGIYDRMTFAGLSATVGIDLAGDRLQLDVPGLVLESLDPGIPLGPLNADLHYAAHVNRLASGSLRVAQAQLQVLGGQLALEPAVLDLGTPRQGMVVDISGLELERLFAVYPAEGLRGRGTLDGQLPVALIDGELVIDAGEVGARSPGGFLQYRSDKLKDLAETTPGMRQVAQALDDFHYDLLNAGVTYGQGGILILDLALQGRNPALQGGRPIHLNIRLEEDVPALLASLQLSGKVSDVIQQRIKQRLLERQADP